METNQLIDLLIPYVTPERLARINEVVVSRTEYITLVLEDVYDSHNTSAVVRSADCFGLQSLYVIENQNRFTMNAGVAKGASKWVDITSFNKKKADNTKRCYDALRDKGYTIVATSPHPKSHTLQEIPIDAKMALIFGTEREGLSDNALEHADTYLHIPMYGFTESFNISVTAALCAYELTNRLRSSDIDWRLPQEQQDALKLTMMKKSIRGVDALIERLIQNKG